MQVLDAAQVIQFFSDVFHSLDEIRRSTGRRSCTQLTGVHLRLRCDQPKRGM